MILDGVSYSAFTQYCRVILSRYSRTLLLSVFSRASTVWPSTEYFCLQASIDVPLCFPQCYAVNTIRYAVDAIHSISSSPRLLELSSGEGVTIVSSGSRCPYHATEGERGSPRGQWSRPPERRIWVWPTHVGGCISNDEGSFRSIGQEAGRDFR